LKLLESREICVSKLVDVLGLSQSTVSGHLSVLINAGLVTVRREGRKAHYALSDQKKNQYALPLLALMLGWLEDDPLVRGDRRRMARITHKT